MSAKCLARRTFCSRSPLETSWELIGGSGFRVKKNAPVCLDCSARSLARFLCAAFPFPPIDGLPSFEATGSGISLARLRCFCVSPARMLAMLKCHTRAHPMIVLFKLDLR